MLIKQVVGDIFTSEYKQIAFPICQEGFNDQGFAAVIANNLWPELLYTGQRPLGQVLTKRVRNITLYALVIFSLKPEGWQEAPQYLKAALHNIPVSDEEVIACVKLGFTPEALKLGANPDAILIYFSGLPARL